MRRMRIAISGTHATGKSTLVDELARRLEGFLAMPELYYQLEDEGHVFADRPTFDDLDMLFERSIESLTTCRAPRALFDRSPLDYLAYLAVMAPETDLRTRVAKAHDTLACLDLVVFVPIEKPDQLAVTEALGLRRRVDRLLREMLVEGSWGFDVPLIEVHGSPQARALRVIHELERLAPMTDDTGHSRPG